MRALRWHGSHDLRYEEVPPPSSPGPGHALVAVAYCGICGTDVQEYAAGPVMIQPRPHRLTGQEPPLTLGHEFSGTILELGDSDSPFAVGDRVAVDPCWRCGSCWFCDRGDYHICRRGGSVGLASDGALAPVVLVQSAGLVKVPDEVPLDLAALTEPLAVGHHGVRRGRVGEGDRVLVLGAGPVGATAILAAQAAGAAEVYVSEVRESRRDLAARLGATRTLDPTTEDVRRLVYEATDRVGPDVVVECTGVPAMATEGVAAARRGGRVVLLGIGHDTTPLDPSRLTLYERELIGSLGYNHDFPRVLAHIAEGRMDPRPLITGVVPLERAVEDGFDVLTDPGNPHVKLLVEVAGGD